MTINTQEQQPEVRELFNVSLSFFVPQEGTVTIAAKDKNHAVELILELMKNYKDVQIVDVYPLSSVNMMEDEEEAEDKEWVN